MAAKPSIPKGTRDFSPVESVEKDVLVAMAVYIGKTRLIDNFSYEV